MTLEFFAEIDVENSVKHVSTRAIEYKLRKKEAKDEFWPRLLKENRKVQFVKTDFDKVCADDEFAFSGNGGGEPERIPVKI